MVRFLLGFHKLYKANPHLSQKIQYYISLIWSNTRNGFTPCNYMHDNLASTDDKRDRIQKMKNWMALQHPVKLALYVYTDCVHVLFFLLHAKIIYINLSCNLL